MALPYFLIFISKKKIVKSLHIELDQVLGKVVRGIF